MHSTPGVESSDIQWTHFMRHISTKCQLFLKSHSIHFKTALVSSNTHQTQLMYHILLNVTCISLEVR